MKNIRIKHSCWRNLSFKGFLIISVFLSAILLISSQAKAQDYLKMGFEAQDKANLDDAIKYYNLALQKDSNLLAAYIKRGLCYQDLSQFDLALKDFKKANEIKPGDPDIEMSIGTTCFHLKDYRDAEKYLETALKKMPDNARAQFDLALAKSNMKDYNGALPVFDKAISLEPDKSQYYYSRAEVEDRMRKYEDALADCNKAIKLQTNYEKAYFLRAKEENELRLYNKALKDLDVVIGMNPKNTRYYAEKGDIEYHQGNLKASINDCSKAINLNSLNAEAYYSKALAETDSGMMDSAKLDMAHSNMLFKNKSPFVWIETAKINIFNGDYAAASDAAQKTLQLDPKYIFAAYQLAYSESYMGHDSVAMQILQRLVKADSNFAISYWLMGRITYGGGNKLASMLYFYKGITSKTDPLGQAYCYAFVGDEKKAETIIKRIIKSDDSVGYRIKARDLYGDLAYVYGVTKDEDKFFASLNRAFAAGYANKGWIVNSPELFYLKDKPAYKELAAKYHF